MKQASLVIFLLFCFHLTTTSAQKLMERDLSSDLLFYGDIMMNGFENSSRERAAVMFEKLFDQYLTENKTIDEEEPFRNYISVLPSPNNDFTLVSWMVKLDDRNCSYKGYLLKNNEVIKFNRTEGISQETAYSTSTVDDWYGCLYYEIMEHEKDSYLLFGFDGEGKYDNQRLIDVLTINGDEISFGAPIFEDSESLDTYLNRIIISYSSDASVVLHYHPGLDLIIHDHLLPRMGQQAGQGPTNIPDGSYEGYQKKGNKWMYREKIYNHTYEEAPRPQPVFQDKTDNKKGK